MPSTLHMTLWVKGKIAGLRRHNMSTHLLQMKLSSCSKVGGTDYTDHNICKSAGETTHTISGTMILCRLPVYALVCTS